MDGHQVPQELVTKVGEAFECILKETDKVRQEHSDDMSISCAFSIIFERRPELRSWKGLHIRYFNGTYVEWKVGLLQMLILSHLKAGTKQEELLPGGHELMVRGYLPVINTLAKGLDIRLNHM